VQASTITLIEPDREGAKAFRYARGHPRETIGAVDGGRRFNRTGVSGRGA
jgi:hypothetical protein